MENQAEVEQKNSVAKYYRIHVFRAILLYKHKFQYLKPPWSLKCMLWIQQINYFYNINLNLKTNDYSFNLEKYLFSCLE